MGAVVTAPEVVVAGYASIDHVYRASAPPAVGRTAILAGAADAPPHFGGCGPTAARTMARLGRRVGVVTWLGDDDRGRAYLATLRDEGIDVRGVTVAAGRPSPRCFLFYDPDGGATCYYHPSDSGELRLFDGARTMLAGGRAMALTVGPAALTAALLDARPPGTVLAWGVKADPHAYPVSLRRRLLVDADLICLNRGELPFLAEALPDAPATGGDEATIIALRQLHGAIVAVTAGAAGCRVVWDAGDAVVPADTVSVPVDPTGSGDMFFGGLVAAWLDGASPPAAARAAAGGVAAALRERAAREGWA